MSKRTFITFGVLLFVLAVVIPWLAFRGSGDANTGAQKVPAHLKTGQALFETNCGTCHTLYAAGTDGNYGPNLDELLAPTGQAEGRRKAAEGVAGTRCPERGEGRRRLQHARPHAPGDPERRAAAERSRRIRRRQPPASRLSHVPSSAGPGGGTGRKAL